MAYTETLTQGLAMPAAALPPANRAANTNNTNLQTCWYVGPANMSNLKRALGIVNVGVTVGAACTITATFMSSANSNTLNTSSWTAVANAALATCNTSNQVLTVEIRNEQMPAGQPYLALLVNNQCAAFFGAELFGGESAAKPASQFNVNTTLLAQSVT